MSFGIAFFLIALVPTSVVPLAEVTNDHRMFFPFVGFSIAVVWTIYLLLEKQFERIPAWAVATTMLVICCAYGFGTSQRNAVWQTEESLWKDVTEKSPRNGRGLMNYGRLFMARGSFDTANYYYSEALRYTPNYGILHCNMGVLQTAMGHADVAENHFKQAISLDPANPEIYHFYAISLQKNGHASDAITALYKSLQYSESNVEVRHQLMDLLFEQGRFEELKQVSVRTLQLIPGDASAQQYVASAAGGKSALQVAEETAASKKTPEAYLDLSLRYYQAKEFQQSIDAAKAAVALKPDYEAAYSNICAAYNELGQFAEGKKAGEAAIRLNPNDPMAKANLAWSVSELEKKK